METKTLKKLCLFIFVLKIVDCHPISKSDLDNQLKNDEKRFPNGTIVGKYSYTDNEGNPIQVKYYADDSSYGVELKSIKVMSGTSDNPLMQNFKQPTTEYMLHNSEAPLETLLDFYNPTNTKYKISEPFEILKNNKDANKNPIHKPDFKATPDYEIYFENELKTPKKCGKDKVRVYLDKEKRKIRDVSDSYMQAVKYCNQL